MDKYSARINCAYNDDGENISINFDYKDSNGVSMQTKKEGTDIGDLTQGIIDEIMSAMVKAKQKANKPKRPEDMTKEELLEALKLMEKEANSARTRNDMLERRLREQDAERKPVETENARKPKYRNKVDTKYDIMKEYQKFLDMFDSLG